MFGLILSSLDGEREKTFMKLKNTIIELLRAALEEPRIEIEELNSGEVTGTVSSRSFTPNTVAQNRRLLETIFKEVIPEHQYKKIDILPLSTKDQKILDDFFLEL